ncbi:hypothetical protein F2Q70_00044388 [Brassica cretica]|uniref:Uncharacterized protein n=1 Tax=Brassica cretica TaxID=69181 RepID=A0A8S9KHE5_BRACR|nr:hypothetical protein F2Q70_00044388 [Brassica cretica]
MGVKPSSTKKAVQKPQSKPVVETPLTRTEKKRNKGFEKYLESFKARIHQRGRTRDCKCSPDCPKEAGDVVDSGPEADHEKDRTTAYASGDILGSFSCDKLVQPFVCKEYDPVKLLRHEEGLQNFIFEPGEETLLIGLIHEVLDREKLMGLIQNMDAFFSFRNQCLKLFKKGPTRIYIPWSNNMSIRRSFGARLIQSTNLRVILQFRAYHNRPTKNRTAVETQAPEIQPNHCEKREALSGTTAYDLYPLSAKYERSWMPLFPEIDCQEKLWSRVFVIESVPASLI